MPQLRDRVRRVYGFNEQKPLILLVQDNHIGKHIVCNLTQSKGSQSFQVAVQVFVGRIAYVQPSRLAQISG